MGVAHAVRPRMVTQTYANEQEWRRAMRDQLAQLDEVCRALVGLTCRLQEVAERAAAEGTTAPGARSDLVHGT
jgi:hypothetical protein